jgi:O-methyltransferase/aklanonic acid methyltransferase
MSSKANEQKEHIAGVFSRAASAYDRVGPQFFTHFGRRFVDLAEITPGARVLDIASGRGAILFPAAEQVGTDGSVIGIRKLNNRIWNCLSVTSLRNFRRLSRRMVCACPYLYC